MQATETPPPKNRHGVPCNFWISDALDAAVQEFRGAQDVEPTEVAVFRQALTEFLVKRGYWPPKKK